MGRSILANAFEKSITESMLYISATAVSVGTFRGACLTLCMWPSGCGFLYMRPHDLGLGRAPGGDFHTMRALRRDSRQSGDDFPELLVELRTYLGPEKPGQVVKAIPGQGSRVPITLLGSSGFSAQLAAMLGLPFAFAAHFAPDMLVEATQLYRMNFRPSEVLEHPWLMVGVPVIAAESDATAHRLFTTPPQRFLRLIRNQPVEFPVAQFPKILTSGDAATEIARIARGNRFDLIIMPTHLDIFRQMLLGSTTAKVINDADCSVLTSRHAQTIAPRPLEHREWLCAVGLS